jgi:signal transduction histidine kinase
VDFRDITRIRHPTFSQEHAMNIAVVGGGTRCKRLMEVIEQHAFQDIHPKIVGVADTREDAPGMVKAKQNGLFVSLDYNDFFDRDDIDLIMELTGDPAIYDDILSKKKKTVRAVSSPTASLFWEIARVSTLQKKTDQQLREVRATYQAFINELIQEDVLVIAYNHRIMDVNETLLNKLKLKREEVIGRYCYEITHRQAMPCSGENHPCPLIQTLETQQPSRSTHVHYDKNNKEIHYSISTYPLIEEGDVIGAIEISRDITHDINLQKAMMQNEKLVSIGRLSAGVAHEINNPLTTILTTAMLIQEDLSPEDANHQELETIIKETLRCRKIVTSLLDFARQNRPKMKAADINEVVAESIFLTKKQAAFKGLTIKSRLGENIPRIHFDKSQIQQSIINLIINAIEVLGEGGAIEIATRFNAQKENVEITIQDNGPGIDHEHVGKIFDPFFTTKEGGTGLGLAITHGILEQHKGRIEVESTPGEGTTFTVVLPTQTGGSDAE